MTSRTPPRTLYGTRLGPGLPPVHPSRARVGPRRRHPQPRSLRPPGRWLPSRPRLLALAHGGPFNPARPIPTSPAAELGGALIGEPGAAQVEPVREPGAQVVAAVDVGANSVHLLVAVVTGRRVEPLVDESVFLGLGDRVDTTGTLGPSKRGELVATLVRYAETARRLGAELIAFVGTEPMRRASDAASAVQEVGLATGVPLYVLDPREEAELTLIGVTLGRPITRELAVVDVGGGSSQIALIGPDHPPASIGLRLGGARLTAAFVASDPPTEAEVERLRAEARRLVAELPELRAAELIAVGGTASNLVKVLPAAALDRRLDRNRLEAALEVLRSEPSASAAERHAINPTRARLLPAGSLILEAVMAHLGVDGLAVSEAGVREGTVLAQAHAGRAWRDQLAALARGWPKIQRPNPARGGGVIAMAQVAIGLGVTVGRPASWLGRLGRRAWASGGACGPA